jgi:hypothetical protein
MKKSYTRPEVQAFGNVESLTQTKVYGNSHPLWVA